VLFNRSVAHWTPGVYLFWQAGASGTCLVLRTQSRYSEYEVRNTQYERSVVLSLPQLQYLGRRPPVPVGLKGNPPPAQVGPHKGPFVFGEGPRFDEEE
jgi:hypothetical protein